MASESGWSGGEADNDNDVAVTSVAAAVVAVEAVEAVEAAAEAAIEVAPLVLGGVFSLVDSGGAISLEKEKKKKGKKKRLFMTAAAATVLS